MHFHSYAFHFTEVSIRVISACKLCLVLALCEQVSCRSADFTWDRQPAKAESFASSDLALDERKWAPGLAVASQPVSAELADALADLTTAEGSPVALADLFTAETSPPAVASQPASSNVLAAALADLTRAERSPDGVASQAAAAVVLADDLTTAERSPDAVASEPASNDFIDDSLAGLDTAETSSSAMATQPASADGVSEVLADRVDRDLLFEGVPPVTAAERSPPAVASQPTSADLLADALAGLDDSQLSVGGPQPRAQTGVLGQRTRPGVSSMMVSTAAERADLQDIQTPRSNDLKSLKSGARGNGTPLVSLVQVEPTGPERIPAHEPRNANSYTWDTPGQHSHPSFATVGAKSLGQEETTPLAPSSKMPFDVSTISKRQLQDKSETLLGFSTASLVRQADHENENAEVGNAYVSAVSKVRTLQNSTETLLGLSTASLVSHADQGIKSSKHASVGLQVFNDQASDWLGLMDVAGEIQELETVVDTATNVTVMAPKSKTTFGVHQNALGDGKAFLLNLGINGLAVTLCILFFAMVRQRYSFVFQGNRYTGKAPCVPSTNFCGWIGDSYKYSTMDLAEHVGLDSAMLLEYCNLCMKILLVIGIPLILVEAPLNIFCGGNAAGQDHLSWQGMANVDDGRKYFYWFYAALVWFVVIITQIFIFGSMKKFLKIRFDWIRVVPPPQSQTIMLEHIPAEICSDKKLRAYFNNVFGEEVVLEAHVVKYVGELKPLTQKLQQERAHLKEQLINLNKTGMRPQTSSDGQADAIDVCRQKINSLEAQIATERMHLEYFAEDDQFSHDVWSSSAFVIFNSITAAASALSFNYTEDGDELVASVPPQPNDVIYEGLLQTPSKARVKEIIGYTLLLGLFFAFLPIILFISMVTEIATVEQISPYVKTLVEAHPGIALIWNAMFGSIAVTFMMSFLPTFLMLIFYNCFALTSSVQAQHMCQKWYFLFLVTFVLLVTSVGASLISTLKEIANSPLMIFSLLASNMPSASHYYLSWVATQLTTHAMELTRYVTFVKYVIFEFSSGDANYAKEMSEPEDQDFYGIGARSARFTLLMCTTLAFCTLSPLIVVLGFINFALCRVVFGYLFAYAEVPKPVIGGHFFASQLKQTQVGLFIYVILMTGVLFQRAPNTYPAIIAFSAFAPLIWSMMRFDRRFRWEALPAEYCRDSEGVTKIDPRVYVQPEISEVLEGDPYANDSKDRRIPSVMDCMRLCRGHGGQSDGDNSVDGS